MQYSKRYNNIVLISFGFDSCVSQPPPSTYHGDSVSQGSAILIVSDEGPNMGANILSVVPKKKFSKY